ncbi:GNAT family N-acetyltransferase [Ornithinibacillus halotolerans]|uniref:Acetyltransferase n=1 Tax=Ornithinibacillus halotolerans TaxID=1274357 RepID=A0A916S822_9BACI|nr:GNAT family N-acetyltransferase [Ornithinibacillus halotolerans]GGA85391.1 acetyltransferase [Ornithinibacillus halotolerans]
MKQFKLETNYSNNNYLREKLYPLFETVFGIEVDTFKDFYARGFWDATYTPFTLFHGNRAIANVSVFDMPLVINGEKKIAAGIQSVMTDPNYRGQGLMNSLMNKALKYIDSKYEQTFLMTSNSDLYMKFGFKIVKEYYFTRKWTHTAAQTESSLIHLDMFDSNDIQIIRWAFANNKPSSSRFYPINYAPSFYLNMYNPILHEMVFFSPELNVIIIYEVDDGVLELYDIIGPELPSLEKICSVIPFSFTDINIYFSPDLFPEEFEAVEYNDVDYLMVRGEFELMETPIMLPIVAEF